MEIGVHAGFGEWERSCREAEFLLRGKDGHALSGNHLGHIFAFYLDGLVVLGECAEGSQSRDGADNESPYVVFHQRSHLRDLRREDMRAGMSSPEAG